MNSMITVEPRCPSVIAVAFLGCYICVPFPCEEQYTAAVQRQLHGVPGATTQPSCQTAFLISVRLDLVFEVAKRSVVQEEPFAGSGGTLAETCQ